MCRLFIISLLSLASMLYAAEKEQQEIVIDDQTLVIDVRSAEEFKGGHIKNAINIPHTEIKNKIGEHVKDKGKKIVLYCRSGHRAGLAEKALKEIGFTNVTNAGGYENLKKKLEGKDKK